MAFQSLYESARKSCTELWSSVKADARGVAVVPRSGDLLLHVRSDCALEGLFLTVGSGDTPWERFDLPSGSTHAPLGGTPLPLICLRFHEVCVQGLPPGATIEFGLVCLDSCTRRELAMGSWWMPAVHRPEEHFQVGRGMGHIQAGATPTTDAVDPPHFLGAVLATARLWAPALEGPGRVRVLSDVLSPEACAQAAAALPRARPELILPDVRLAELIDSAIASQLSGWKRSGDLITAGVYESGEGIARHREGALQGGVISFLLCVEAPAMGGETEFEPLHEDPIVVPAIAGQAVVFDLEVLHAGRPVVRGRKGIVACELTLDA